MPTVQIWSTFAESITDIDVNNHSSALWLYCTSYRYDELAIYIDDRFCIG